MKKNLIVSIYLLLAGICFQNFLLSQPTQHYTVENGSIAGKNIDRYNNHPLYINNTNAFVLTGDQPIARLVKDQYLYGTFMLAIERNGKAKWLQQCDQRTSIYQPGCMNREINGDLHNDLKII